MAIVELLLNLSGAIFLLLFAVRQVRTGIERAHGASFQRMITQQNSLIGASGSGLILASILQSSAAVGLLVTGFAANGFVGFPIALATILGADLGSALIIQVLSFRLDWLVPLLLTIGGWFFVKTISRKLRQYGRILLGVAFILISLQFLRQAVVPIRDSDFLPAIASYLASDFITAYMIGAFLALIMHSSVATILMCVTLVQVNSIPFEAGLSLVLGANFGSALIPIWLSRGFDIASRRPVFANLFLRGAWSFVILLALNLLPGFWHESLQGAGAQTLVFAHIAFNVSLLVLALPLCRTLEPIFELTLPDRDTETDQDGQAGYQSCLDPDDMEHPPKALANLKRELLHMMSIIDRMFTPVLSAFIHDNQMVVQEIRDVDKEVNACFDGIRDYVSHLPKEHYSKEQSKLARDMLEFAIRLETAGDVLAKRVSDLAEEAQQENSNFSQAGQEELAHLHDLISNNLRLANNVLISDDLECARLLSLEKSEIKRLERKSRKRHLKRLEKGLIESISSSNAHLELLRAFREFNSHICAVAYPILYKHGQLLETRLIHNIPEKA
ncbi:MAG: Na/Pi cotransporter family protein [Dinoroseobacter sp.]|nr:Na/Pi cotransporter family protein [Dinoroseobacter sp.]